ncbi:MAG TPA: NAD(P)/FAD-dependent oxidoreductase [Planctomycetaceae bacterium]|nr:NAD(P)/FAD-dependent oxidoreductase [Planctomycetaceae bacterium]
MSAQSQYDVIIVGGGPGGSTAAWKLANAGLRPLILEAKEFPRVKLCAGWVTPPVWQDLELDPQQYPLTIQSFSRVRLLEHGRVRESQWSDIVGYGIVRREFDNFLLERAMSAGAEVKFGVRVDKVESTPEGMQLQANGETYTARVVIGAGGTHCPIAKRFSPKPDDCLVVALEAETHLSLNQLQSWTPFHGVPELAAEPDFLGYGWYFTKQDYLNIGVGSLRAGAPIRDRLERYRQDLVAAGRLPADATLENFKGHSYYVNTHACPVAGDHWLLVGDSAGLAKPVSGEGIGPAIHSGRLAAAAICDYLKSGAPLAAYERALRGPKRSRGWLSTVGAWCPASLITVLAKTVCRVGPLRKRLLFEGCFGMRAKVSA